MNKAIPLAASAAFALGAILVPSAQTANVTTDGYVYLNADDPSGQFSFAADNGRWYSDGAAVSGAPSSGHAYLVQATSGDPRRLRVNTASAFEGDSLTLDNGAIFAQCNGTFTVGDLIVYDGAFRAITGDAVPCLAGAVELKNGANFKIEGAAGRMAEVSADISGSGTITVAEPENTNAGSQPLPYWTVRLSGDNSHFSGRLFVQALTTGRAWPSALIATSVSALGAGDVEGGSAVELMGRCAFFGDGLDFTNPAYSIATGGNPRFGSYANGAGGYGLKFDGGVSIASSAFGTTLYVTNVVGTTVLGNVSLTSFSKIVVQSGTVRFTTGWNHPTLPVEVCAGASISCDEGATLGTVSSADGIAPVSVALPAIDVAATNRTNAAFAIPVLSAQSINLDDFHLYGGVRREYFTVEDNAGGGKTLWWKRDADAHDVVYMATTGDQFSFGPTANYPTSANPWRWSDGAKPTAVNDYIVESGKIVRCRATNTFAGNSLSILPGGDLSVYDFTATANALALFEDSRCIVRGTSAGTIAGAATVRTSASGYANVEIENGTMTLTAAISGDGNVRYRALEGKADKTGSILVTGDNSALVGKVALMQPKVTVKFAGERAVGGNPARFTPDGLSVAAGVTLRCESAYPFGITNANRGVTLNGAMTIEVDEGMDCPMTTPICGTGSVRKIGAGTLRLGSDGSSFSGGVTLEAGVIDAVSGNAFGASALTYSDGLLRVSCDGPLTIRGAAPVVRADGAGCLQVLPTPGGAAWDGRIIALFLLPDASTSAAEALVAGTALAGAGDDATVWDVESTSGGTLVSVRKRQPTTIIMR